MDCIKRIYEVIWELEGLNYVHAGLFESSRKHFNRRYSFSSKKTKAVSEVLIMNKKKGSLSGEPSKQRKPTLQYQESFWVKAYESYGACMETAGPLKTLAAVEAVSQKDKPFTNLMKTADCKKDFGYKVWEQLQTGELRTLSKIFGKYFEPESTDLDDGFSWRLPVPYSAFVVVHKVPSLQQNNVISSLIVDRACQRFLQRVFAVGSYYRWDAKRVYSVISEANEE